ncbi:hypothetical protein, partial [Thalassoglobus sp.]|uniref:hypothetical protein n=1 Tax=Thalassoglobus sp. TaxID=2795869 RepID=UPI003AA7D6D2
HNPLGTLLTLAPSVLATRLHVHYPQGVLGPVLVKILFATRQNLQTNSKDALASGRVSRAQLGLNIFSACSPLKSTFMSSQTARHKTGHVPVFKNAS